MFVEFSLISSASLNKNAKGINDYTPLHLACMRNHLPIIKYLIQKQNADLLATTKQGLTLLNLTTDNQILNFLRPLGILRTPKPSTTKPSTPKRKNPNKTHDDPK